MIRESQTAAQLTRRHRHEAADDPGMQARLSSCNSRRVRDRTTRRLPFERGVVRLHTVMPRVSRSGDGRKNGSRRERRATLTGAGRRGRAIESGPRDGLVAPEMM